MRRIDKNENGRTYVIETYESFAEIIDTNKRRPVKDEAKWDAAFKTTGESYFMGTENLDEAINLLKYGYTKDLEIMKKRITRLEKQGGSNETRMSFKNDVVGFAPNVPNAIMGNPLQMINDVRVPKKSKVVTLLIDMAVCSGVSKESVFEYGCKVVERIVQLEKNGFRVRVEYLKCFNVDDTTSAVSTVIKNENQPLDIKRIMFPLTNVAMQRYISWDWFDRVPNSKWSGGRGMSLSVVNNTERQKIIKAIVGDEIKNKYVIIYGDDLDEVFKNLSKENQK